jgi:hypothetical protein
MNASGKNDPLHSENLRSTQANHAPAHFVHYGNFKVELCQVRNIWIAGGISLEINSRSGYVKISDRTVL